MTKAPHYPEDPNLLTAVKEYLVPLNAGPAVESLSKQNARNVLINAQAAVQVNLTGISESEKTIITEGYTIKLDIVMPQGNSGILPVFIFIHGGGWILGDYPTHKRMVRDLVVLSGYACVFINYTASPEAKYPQAINEIYAATKWVARNGHEIGVDGKKMAMVGNSVGGNMAAVTALFAKENQDPIIKLLIMMWPVTNASFDTESYQLYAEERFLTTSLMKWMYDQYTTELEKRKEIYISLLRASEEQLTGLPPTLIQVAENDILRDEGEAFGRKLDRAGVPVTTVRYNGVIHDFGLLNGLAELPTVRSLFIHAAAELKNYLG